MQEKDGVPQPFFNGTLTVTNLDTLSPEPKVDEQACSRAKADLAQDPQNEFLKVMAEADCTPRGGMLDFVREYLRPENRTVQADGTTQDVIRINIDNNKVFVNGKRVVTPYDEREALFQEMK